MEPSLYERIGDEGILLLTTLFYDRVFSDDDEQWFMNIFSSSTKQEAIDNQVCVCVCVYVSVDIVANHHGHSFVRVIA